MNEVQTDTKKHICRAQVHTIANSRAMSTPSGVAEDTEDNGRSPLSHHPLLKGHPSRVANSIAVRSLT